MSLGAVFTVGIWGINFLDSKIEDIYIDRKLVLEKELGKRINKKIILGNYDGLRFFGLGISSSKVFEKENINSKIEAENVYIGIMPIRSFLNQKWIINVKPQKTIININQNFFKIKNSIIKDNKLSKEKLKYDLNLTLKKFTKFKLHDLNIDTKVKGNFRYSSQPNQIDGYLKSRFGVNENLIFKFDSKLDQNSLSFQILTNGINLKNLNINNFNNAISLKKGKLQSNFKYSRSPTKAFCEGRLSLSNIELKSKNFEENIVSDNVRFVCENNNLIVRTNNIKYGTLLSELNFEVPLNKSINNINLEGYIRYSSNPKSKISVSGILPYWFDKRGLNIGKIDSKFNLTRTELANLNIFRKNGIQGLITAEGSLKGNLDNPELNVDFNVDTPYYKGVRFRETWVGDISNKNKNFLVNIQSRSRIPSFLTLNFDSNIKLSNLIFTRKFDASNEGTLNIVRNNNNYTWEAKNLPLDEIEFSPNNSKFDRISGTINGSGILSSDLSNNEGKIGWSFGKFRNLDLRNAYFNFNIKGNEYFGDSFIIPDDGGIIKILFDSKKNKILDMNFDNVNTKWIILNAFNTFKIEDNYTKFDIILESLKAAEKNKVIQAIRNTTGLSVADAKKLISSKKIEGIAKADAEILREKIEKAGGKVKLIEPKGEAKDLNVEGISNKGKTLVEQLKIINEFNEDKSKVEKNVGFENFFRKFESRYSGNLTISGNNLSNYKINSDINGFIDLKNNNILENKKEYFSLNLNGGLFEGEGDLVINQIPLKSMNIFLQEPRDVKGAIDLRLKYDRDKNYFKTNIFTKNIFIKEYGLKLKELKSEEYNIEFNKNGKNRFDLNFSLLFNEINNPITLKGFVPSSKNGIVDLNLTGKRELLKLIDVFYGDNINFKKGDASAQIRMRGPINLPIFTTNLVINDSEIDIFNTTLKDVNTEVEINGDQVKIVRFKAKGDKNGTIDIFGNLPIYEEKISNKKTISFISNGYNLVTKNNDFVLDSVVKVRGSFLKPTLNGRINLSNGFVNIKNSNQRNSENGFINKKYSNNLNDRFWRQNEDLEIISSDEVKISELITTNLKPEYLFNLNFEDFQFIFGPDFRLEYGIDNFYNVIAYIDSPEIKNERKPLVINKSLRDDNDDDEVDLKVTGRINVTKGKFRTLLTTFKFVKNNSIFFAESLGIKPLVFFNLTTKVPERIIPINQNIQDSNLSQDLNGDENSNDFGMIGNSRKIKIDASYTGNLSTVPKSVDVFENFWFDRLQFRSYPGRSRSEIISLIEANSSNIINRTFISQLDGENAFSEKFSLSLYPAIIENNEPTNNVFSSENADIKNTQGSDKTISSSSQAWVAEIGLDIRDNINFAVQATPDRDDLPPLGILTLQAFENLELIGSSDSEGNWKSQIQLFFRY